MRRSDCLACHQLSTASVGPDFLSIAGRYRGDAGAPARLAEKVMNGGKGVWGEVPMAPHPQHTAEEVASMVKYILELNVPGGAAISTPVPAPQ